MPTATLTSVTVETIGKPKPSKYEGKPDYRPVLFVLPDGSQRWKSYNEGSPELDWLKKGQTYQATLTGDDLTIIQPQGTTAPQAQQQPAPMATTTAPTMAPTAAAGPAPYSFRPPGSSTYSPPPAPSRLGAPPIYPRRRTPLCLGNAHIRPCNCWK